MARNYLIKNVPAKSNKRIITAQVEASNQVKLWVHIIGDDLKSDQEKADPIISNQVSDANPDGKKSIKVICEDTDVFVLLCHWNGLKNWEIDLYMANFTEDKYIISIKDTVKKHKVLIPGLLSAHTTLGCDTIPVYYGIGEKKAFNAAS